MTTKNIQLKDLNGNELLPKTSGALVWNGSGASAYNLSTVEEGAEVNIIETVKVNGSALTPDSNRAVNVVIPAADEYTITKDTTAASGYAATYHLTKNNVNVGEAINIPKDLVVESGTVETCTTPDVPVEGYVVGDKYIDLVLANADNSHIYILVSDLIDIYTEGNGINIANNVISVDTTDTNIVDATPTENSTKFVQSGGVYTQLATKVDANSAITAGTHTKITYDANGLVTAGADLAESDIPSLHLAKVTDVTATAAEVNELHSAGAVAADFTKLHAITATAAELNTLDGITATTAELNILDGVTADASELNILDGATLTTTELNYVDGVTSSIQNQLDGKQATITGAATTITSNDLTASMILASDAQGKVAATSIPSNSAFCLWEEITE